MMLLSTQGLSKNFNGLQAVSDVKFALPKGQIRALIGPNGAGKSTFVNLLCGRLQPSAGRIVFAGQDISNFPAHRRINLGMAYTFQITSIFPNLSASENVALAARRRLTKPKMVAACVASVLQQVGLAQWEENEAGDLSYGHQRLLEIAMGLAQSPRLLILDEPTQGLADAEIVRFKSLIREVAKTTTILLIEHNMNVVMEISDFITVMNFGEILFEGTPEQVRGNIDVQSAYLGAG